MAAKKILIVKGAQGVGKTMLHDWLNTWSMKAVILHDDVDRKQIAKTLADMSYFQLKSVHVFFTQDLTIEYSNFHDTTTYKDDILIITLAPTKYK